MTRATGVVLLSCAVAALAGFSACSPAPAGGGAPRAPEPVEEAGFVPIGGIEQWVGVKGADRSNPVILVVHGGPGETQWPVASKYAPWEQRFTVVQWDQRGAGRTFGRNGAATPEVNLDRITRDGIEVVEHLRRTLGKQKVIVLGHSWGSIVAVHMVQRRPELFAAYVGTGQVASWKASVNMQFDRLLERARRDHDAETLRDLEAIG
ncbi:MAG: alpha/beta fold hydrolase, partial [Vicinamibacterales bacterium]